MSDHTTHEIPYGYCHCGCGQRTTISQNTDHRAGTIKGQPYPYLRGHATNKHAQSPNPTGLCMCGCGQVTGIATETTLRRNRVKGHHVQFISGHHARLQPRASVAERFWQKVDKRGPNDCWLWTAFKSSKGYGQLTNSSGEKLAHRISYELHHGPIPDDLCVLHNCPGGDNPTCVNPAHLWLGTQLDNIIDMQNKGRFRPIRPIRRVENT